MNKTRFYWGSTVSKSKPEKDREKISKIRKSQKLYLFMKIMLNFGPVYRKFLILRIFQCTSLGLGLGVLGTIKPFWPFDWLAVTSGGGTGSSWPVRPKLVSDRRWNKLFILTYPDEICYTSLNAWKATGYFIILIFKKWNIIYKKACF